MLKFSNHNLIDVDDWDTLVQEIYHRPYSFQQQDECKPRGLHYITIPSTAMDYSNSTVPEILNHDSMGVSFNAWLEREPIKALGIDCNQRHIDLWWQRNFYPNIQMIANDLHEKGIINAGQYVIVIDW